MDDVDIGDEFGGLTVFVFFSFNGNDARGGGKKDDLVAGMPSCTDDGLALSGDKGFFTGLWSVRQHFVAITQKKGVVCVAWGDKGVR